ncbi:hypothetical protein GQR58_022821 [Nymphon striatum]|nr:hypothetical protein GQR58_022821 [Nymphon striatum]
MGTEYLECRKCAKKVSSWSLGIVSQLPIGLQLEFPAIVSYKYACDIRVIRMLRQRGLGNSTTQIEKKLSEQHSEVWVASCIRYLTDAQPFARTTTHSVTPAPVMPPVPKAKWLLYMYSRDVWSRLDEVKAVITSTFGEVLKMNSTKQVVKKLAGKAAGTAAWSTNVGNQHGQVLMSVLTVSEGGYLQPMVDGLVRRYESAGVSPPRLLYVDRDCCPNSNTHKMFAAWPQLIVRLDIWHFMRRIADSVTTDSHPLYGPFMSRMSSCIFKWSDEDMTVTSRFGQEVANGSQTSAAIGFRGEFIGIEYLYHQTSRSLADLTEDREEEGDGQDVILEEEENASLENEGFEEIDPTFPSTPLLPPPEKAAPHTRRQAEPFYDAIPLMPVSRTPRECDTQTSTTQTRISTERYYETTPLLVLGQGMVLSKSPMAASNPLPPAKDLLTALPWVKEEEQHNILLPASTVGLTKTKARQLAKIVPKPSFLPSAAPLLMFPCSTGSLAAATSYVLPNAPVPYSKSTFIYRKKKGCPTRPYDRKSTPRQCRTCGHPFSEGHRTYYGAIYCPLIATQPVDDWTAMQKAIRESKKMDSREH